MATWDEEVRLSSLGERLERCEEVVNNFRQMKDNKSSRATDE